MKVDYVEETSVRKALTFEVEPELLEQEIEERARKYAKKAKMPGFRPGKIPPQVIKQRFRGAVRDEAVEALINRVVHEELEGRGLRPVATPKVIDLKVEDGQPITFRAVFETLPFIELAEYKGLSVPTRTPEVTDADVDKEVERLRERAARYEPIEGRPAQTEDFVVASVDWVPRGEGTPGHSTDTMIEIGSEANHADVNAALVGAVPGEKRAVTIEYAPDYPSPNLAGKTFEYTFAIGAIKQKIVPPADDELAKDADFETLSVLRAEIRKQLTAVQEREIDGEVKTALLDIIVENTTFDVPEALIERNMSAATEDAVRGLAYQGHDPRKVGIDWKEYREKQRPDSTKTAKADIIVEEIARREDVKVLDAEVDAEIERLALRLRQSKAALKQKLEEDGSIMAVAAQIRRSKTLDLIKANATLEPR